MLIKEGRKHGVFERTEEKILQSVFEFTDMTVKEVMVPDTQMMMIQIDKAVPVGETSIKVSAEKDGLPRDGKQDFRTRISGDWVSGIKNCVCS